MNIPFNKPAIIGNELSYIQQAVESGHISGNGYFTKQCQSFFQDKYGFKKCLLTTSCTDALEMAAILCNIGPGDEVIIPAFTFVSTANAFVLRGASIVLVDSLSDHPNMDPQEIKKKLTNRTKAIVVVHYAGVGCDMEEIMTIAKENDIFVVEDAAQAIDSYYQEKPLGSFGHLSAFSFHETKNIISGEGGMLVINDKNLIERAEIIWEKGTNRSAFFRGQVDKYTWVDVGSSFLPGEIIAAFLFAQLEQLDQIQAKRKMVWNFYMEKLDELQKLGYLNLPEVPERRTNNAHLFYIKCRNLDERSRLIDYMKSQSVLTVFHYIPLHTSTFFKNAFGNITLPNCEKWGNCLLRLPLFYSLQEKELEHIVYHIYKFYNIKA